MSSCFSAALRPPGGFVGQRVGRRPEQAAETIPVTRVSDIIGGAVNLIL